MSFLHIESAKELLGLFEQLVPAIGRHIESEVAKKAGSGGVDPAAIKGHVEDALHGMGVKLDLSGLRGAVEGFARGEAGKLLGDVEEKAEDGFKGFVQRAESAGDGAHDEEKSAVDHVDTPADAAAKAADEAKGAGLDHVGAAASAAFRRALQLGMDAFGEAKRAAQSQGAGEPEAHRHAEAAQRADALS